MSIKFLSFEQIEAVCGGYADINDVEQANSILGDCITKVTSESRYIRKELSKCLKTVSCGEECLTRCAPKKRPKECDYAAWGMLSDAIEEGVIKRC